MCTHFLRVKVVSYACVIRLEILIKQPMCLPCAAFGSDDERLAWRGPYVEIRNRAN